MLKADVSGSLEAFEDEIAKLPQDEIHVNVISAGVGGITESDVMLAAASDAVVLGFNVRPVGDARAAGRARGRGDPPLLGHLPRARRPARRHDRHAAPRGGRGDRRHRRGAPDLPRLARRHHRRLLRHRRARSRAAPRSASCATAPSSTTTTIGSLKRFNDDVREVAAGYECGIVLANYQDVKEGDVFEVYETRQVERALS